MRNRAVVIIERHWQDDKQTLGTCTIIGEDGIPLFSSISLERGWMNNKQAISCIPALYAPYPLALEHSAKFNKNLWEIKEVPNRSETKFHAANYWSQLEGCISLGIHPTDMNKDGYLDVTSSSATMTRFHTVLATFKTAILIIKTAPTVH